MLAGLAGAIVAILAMVGALIISLIVMSWRMSASTHESIGWDPVSLSRHQPLLLIASLLVIFAVIARSFVFGYRLQARHIRTSL